MRSKVKIKKKPLNATAELEKIAKSMSGPNSVKVGLPKGSNDYPDGTSVIMVGTVHEFGSPSKGIPQRSFLRSTIIENRRVYKKLFKKLSKKIIGGEINTNKALSLIGLQVQGDVIEKISSGISPALKSREGTPLNDTGHLKQSITFQVDK